MGSEPDSSAVRAALWRALHVQLDDPPHVLDDEIGLALVAYSSGVSMYITKPATEATLERLATLPAGSVTAMTFMLPVELADEVDRPGLEGAARGARASGTPWISFYTPEEIVALATSAGFDDVRCVTTAEVSQRYLAERSVGLRAASGENILLART